VAPRSWRARAAARRPTRARWPTRSSGSRPLAEAHRPSLRALDINPLSCSTTGHGVVAVDWLIELG